MPLMLIGQDCAERTEMHLPAGWLRRFPKKPCALAVSSAVIRSISPLRGRNGSGRLSYRLRRSHRFIFYPALRELKQKKRSLFSDSFLGLFTQSRNAEEFHMLHPNAHDLPVPHDPYQKESLQCASVPASLTKPSALACIIRLPMAVASEGGNHRDAECIGRKADSAPALLLPPPTISRTDLFTANFSSF